MSDTQCTECERPVADGAVLCRTCGEYLAERLNAIPGMLYELATTRAGLARFRSALEASQGSEAPLLVQSIARNDDHESGAELVGDRALARLARLEDELFGWARVLGEELAVCPAVGTAYLIDLVYQRRGDAGRDAAALTFLPATLLEQTAVWLAIHTDRLRAHEAAPELNAELHRAIRGVQHVIDRPAERRSIGACTTRGDDGYPCGFELRAGKDDTGKDETWIRCPRCKQQCEVAAVLRDTLAAADRLLFTLDEVQALLERVEEPIPRGTIHSWVSRRQLLARGWRRPDGRIVAVTTGERDKPMYRLGEIRHLRTMGLRDTAERKRSASLTTT